MDALDINPDADKDMFNEPVHEVFPNPYHLASQSAIGMDQTYILSLARNCEKNRLGAALSNETVALFDLGDGGMTLMKTRLTGAHKSTITGLSFNPVDPNTFFTSSLDQTVKMWDTREDLSKPARTFVDTTPQTHPHSKPKPLTTFDVNATGSHLVAGTEQVQKDAFLLFWDAREGKLLGGYWDSHEDDLATVRFHPEDGNKLASSGTDGIVNVFDLAETSEDDALVTSHNTESSVSRLTWIHDRKKGADGFDTLAILSHTEELALWQTEDNEPELNFSREDACVAIRRKLTEVCYYVDVHEAGEDNELLVLAGSSVPSKPALRFAQVKKNRLKPYADLSGHKTALTRCSVFDSQTREVFTGGEDGVVCLYRPGVESETAKGGATNVIKSKKKKDRSNPY